MVYTPGMLSVVSNEFGNVFLREIMSHHIFCCEMVLKCIEWSWKGSRGGYGLEKGPSSVPYILGKGVVVDGPGKYGQP